MAVSSDISRVQYSGNGSTVTPYVIPFYFLKTSHVKVDVDGTELVGGFTTTGEGNENGGSLTTAAAYTSGQKITIYRIVPNTQQFTYSQGGSIGEGTLERNQDTACMQIQQTAEQAGRSLKFAISSDIAPEIPRTANTSIVIDANGNPAVKTATEMIGFIGVKSSVDAAAASATAASASQSATAANLVAVEAYAQQVADNQNLLQLRIGGYLELRTA